MDWSDKLLYGSFIISCLLLNLKSHITYFTLLFARICIKGANLPTSEDIHFLKLKKGEELKEDDPLLQTVNHPDHPDQRINRILVNESQSFTFYLLNALAFLFVCQFSNGTFLNQINAVFGSICFSLYVLFRYAYYFCYLFSLQPFRTITFVCGSLTQFVLGIYTLVVFIVALSIY